MEEKLTFGETIRRKRRAKKWSLVELQKATGLSYSYLSRVENDSASPQVEAVAKIAEALDADVTELLELAQCLPEVILKRLAQRTEASASALNRTAGAGADGPKSSVGALVTELAVGRGLPVPEANELADVVERLVALPPDQRSLATRLILTLESNLERR